MHAPTAVAVAAEMLTLHQAGQWLCRAERQMATSPHRDELRRTVEWARIEQGVAATLIAYHLRRLPAANDSGSAPPRAA